MRSMRWRLILALTVATGLLNACLGPQQKQAEAVTYLLQARFPTDAAPQDKLPLTLLVQPMRAHAGFDQTRMVYQREANRLEYFAYNRWVDAPARMLTPLLTQALDANGSFSAVVRAPTSVRADVRLETELMSLVHDFTHQPSQVRVVIRAQLFDIATHKVLGTRQIEASVIAGSENPRGGAAAANQATTAALQEIAAWSASIAVNATRP